MLSCNRPGDVSEVVKVGVIAPFEGVGRRLGYEVLSAVKREVAVANGEHALGRYKVAVVALNDNLDPREAAAQARTLASDPSVIAVIGPWSEAAAESAVPVLDGAGMPALLAVPDGGWGPAIGSLCSTSGEVSEWLLRAARDFGASNVVVSGPDTPTRRALLARERGLAVVPDSAPTPCREDSDGDCLVIYTGDAGDSARSLRRWRESGWKGRFLVGPDAVRPWLIEQGGAAAEGVQAVVCGNVRRQESEEEVSLQAMGVLARAATRSVLSGLGESVAQGGRPSRLAVSESLKSTPLQQGLAWVIVRNGRWHPLLE